MRGIVNELEIEKNHADHMAAMAQFWMRRAQDAEMMLAVAVFAAGGKVTIHRDQLESGHKLELEYSKNPADLSLNLKSRTLG